MFKALLEDDGVQREELIEDTDGFVIKTTQNMEPILRRAEQLRQHKQTAGNFRLAATVPANIWDRWMKETRGEIMHNPVLLRKKLNDPELKKLRIWEGRL